MGGNTKQHQNQSGIAFIKKENVLLLIRNNNMTDSKHISSTFAIIDTIHVVVPVVVTQSTGCKHDKFSN